MRHSFTSPGESNAERDVYWSCNLLWASHRQGGSILNRGNIASGYLICSAEDLAHYLIAQLNEGHYGNVSVISPQGMDAMHQPLVQHQNARRFLQHGLLRWSGQRRTCNLVNGVPAIWHDGDNANFSAQFDDGPQAKLGIVVLNNANGGLFRITGSRSRSQRVYMQYCWASNQNPTKDRRSFLGLYWLNRYPRIALIVVGRLDGYCFHAPSEAPYPCAPRVRLVGCG